MGVDRTYFVIHGRKVVDAGAHGTPHIGRRRTAGAEKSTEVGEHANPEGQNLPVGVESHLCVRG